MYHFLLLIKTPWVCIYRYACLTKHFFKKTKGVYLRGSIWSGWGMFRQLDVHYLRELRKLCSQDSIVNVVLDHAESCIFGNMRITINGLVNAEKGLLRDLDEELGELNEHAAIEFIPKLKLLWRHMEIYGLCVVKYSRLPKPPESGEEEVKGGRNPDENEKNTNEVGDEGVVTSFDVLDPADYIIKYARVSCDKFEFEVYPGLHGDCQWSSLGQDLLTPLKDVRVFTTPYAMHTAPCPMSTLQSIKPHVIAYQRFTVFIFMILQSIASPDWSVHVNEQAPDPKEDFITFPSIDGAHGQGPSVMLRAEEQATKLVQQQVAIDNARNQFNARHVDSLRNLMSMSTGSPLVEPTEIQKVPIWASVPPFVTSGDLKEFQRPTMPTNLGDIKRQLLDDIGAPWGLNHAILQGLSVRDSRTHSSMAANDDRRTKRYASLKQAQMADVMRQCLNEIHSEFLTELRESQMARRVRRRLLHPTFQYQSVSFAVQIFKTQEHSYDDIKRLYDDGVIDFGTFSTMAASTHELTFLGPQRAKKAKIQEDSSSEETD